MDIYPLTASQRAHIWAQLNPQQQAIFDKYTMYRIKSELLNNAFRLDAHWNLVGVNIDQTWDLNGGRNGAVHKFHCECGRPIKYQFVLQAVGHPGKRLMLGSSCFAKYAGIPVQVAREIQGQVNTIQIYMNQILNKFNQGERFPEAQFGGVMDSGMFNAPSVFGQKITDFRAADLPLFANDYSRMVRYKAAYLNGAVLDLRKVDGKLSSIVLNEPAALPLRPLSSKNFQQFPHQECLLIQDALYTDRPITLQDQAQLLTTMGNLPALCSLYLTTKKPGQLATALANTVKHTTSLIQKVRVTRESLPYLNALYTSLLQGKSVAYCLRAGLQAEASVWLRGRNNLHITSKSLGKMLKRLLVQVSLDGGAQMQPDKQRLYAIATKLAAHPTLPSLETVQAICRLYSGIVQSVTARAADITACERALASSGTPIDRQTFNRAQISVAPKPKAKRVIKVMSRKRGLRGSTKLSTEQYEMQMALRHRKKHDKPMQ